MFFFGLRVCLFLMSCIRARLGGVWWVYPGSVAGSDNALWGLGWGCMDLDGDR